MRRTDAAREWMRDGARGATAGALATTPMTAAMLGLYRLLPPGEQYPLPPAEITAVITGRESAGRSPVGTAPLGRTLLAHFGYGALVGSPYGLIGRRLPAPAVLTGIGYALIVWASSYLGWIPVLGILRPATDHPIRRTGLMIAAHLVWGSALGLITGRLRARS